MNIQYIQRSELRDLLNRITDRRPTGKPLFPIFSVYAHRREDLLLRYEPINQFDNGPLAKEGDFCLIDDNDGSVIRNGEKRYSLQAADTRSGIYRRRGQNIVLEPAGTGRWMIIKNWASDQPPQATKHWQPKGGQLNFNPADHDLFMVMGMYNDMPKAGRIGRYGQWRPWAMICLRSCSTIRVSGVEYQVVGNLTNQFAGV